MRIRLQLAAVLLPAVLPAQTADYTRGVALFDTGDFAAAVPYLRRAVDAEPNNAQAWKALGVSYAAQHLYTQAEPALRLACEKGPKLLDACYFFARTLYALDRYEPSLKVLDQITPKTWRIRVAQGQALEALGKPAEAEHELRAAVAEGQSANPQSGTALGLFLVRQGRFDEAVAPLQAVIARHPLAADAQLYLGRALVEQGKLAEAIPHLERAVDLNGASSQAHLLLAKAYARVGRATEAQPHFAAAAKDAGK